MLKKSKTILLRSIRKKQFFKFISEKRRQLYRTNQHIEEDFDLKNKIVKICQKSNFDESEMMVDSTVVWNLCITELNAIFQNKEIFNHLELQSFLELGFIGNIPES